MSSKEKKAGIIDELQETIKKSKIGILVDYRGLTASELTSLRRKLKESDSEFRVVKNTLARFAAERVGKNALMDSFQGPIAIVFGYGEIITVPKILDSCSEEVKENLSIKGGFLGDRLLSLADVMTLAKLPSREVLIGRVIGQMKGPVSALINYLSSPISGMMGLLQARIKQLEGE